MDYEQLVITVTPTMPAETKLVGVRMSTEACKLVLSSKSLCSDSSDRTIEYCKSKFSNETDFSKPPVTLDKNYFNHPQSKYLKLYLELDALEPAETWIVDAMLLRGTRAASLCYTYKERTFRVLRSHRIPGVDKILFVRLL